MLVNCWHYTRLLDKYEYQFTNEFFLFHQIAHASYHFLRGGCGVRPFLDLWLLNHIEHDEERRIQLLKAGGLDTFAAVAGELAAHWFDKEPAGETALNLEKYLIHAGVYGSNENHAAVKQVQKYNKISYILMRIWMPYRDLKLMYPQLEHPVLQPVYEFRRWCKLLNPSMFRRKPRNCEPFRVCRTPQSTVPEN